MLTRIFPKKSASIKFWHFALPNIMLKSNKKDNEPIMRKVVNRRADLVP